MNRQRPFSCRTPWPLVIGVLLGVLMTGCDPKPPQASNPAVTGPLPAGWPSPFRVGFFVGDDVIEGANADRELVEYLGKELGLKTEFYSATSYTAVIEAMRAGRVDAMAVGPLAHILAVREAGAEALAVVVTFEGTEPVYDPSIPPYYFSLILARSESGFTHLAELRGKDFSFVDPASTSGHLFPRATLVRAGLDPEKNLRVVFSGSHAASALAVSNGKVAAGACTGYGVERLVNQGLLRVAACPAGTLFHRQRSEAELETHRAAAKPGELVVLSQSAPIPRTPFAIRASLPAGFKARLREVLLEIAHRPEQVRSLRRWFVDPTQSLGLSSLEAFYDPIREVAQVLELDLRSLP